MTTVSPDMEHTPPDCALLPAYVDSGKDFGWGI